jgi:hypothetical protein
MAYQFNPNDPYRANLTDEEIRRQARLNSLDNEIQPDLELDDGPASGAKIAMFAVAIAVARKLCGELVAAEPLGEIVGEIMAEAGPFIFQAMQR